jgi:hypothetical protein
VQLPLVVVTTGRPPKARRPGIAVPGGNDQPIGHELEAQPDQPHPQQVAVPWPANAAGIPAYLLLELEVPNITWFAPSASGAYVYEQHGIATGDEELQVTGPLKARIVPADLVRLHS